MATTPRPFAFPTAAGPTPTIVPSIPTPPMTSTGMLAGLTIPLVAIIVLIAVVVWAAWYYGAFETGYAQLWWINSSTANSTGGRPATWCYVGTDNGRRICLKIPTPNACGDITTYSTEDACKKGVNVNAPIAISGTSERSGYSTT